MVLYILCACACADSKVPRGVPSAMGAYATNGVSRGIVDKVC